jgi:hypothetical protein
VHDERERGQAVLLLEVAVGKPFAKTRSTLADVDLRAAVHDAFATDRLGATDEMAVFGTHPYRRSSGLARVFPTASSTSSIATLRSCWSSRSLEKSDGPRRQTTPRPSKPI